MKQGNVQKHLNRQRGLITRVALLIAMVSLFVTVGFAQRNYPFPQNYKYPYGQIYTGTDVQTKIQSLYNAWKTTYYVEGTMTGGPQSGKAAARIKFLQPGQDGSLTVSEGIAYGMLITVYMDNATNNTQSMFNRLWTYYLGNVNGNGLMNWKVSGFTGQVAPGTGNANGATDADIDVANALLMAHKQWGSAGTVNYLQAAKTLINAIYTFEVDGNKLLKPGDAFNDYANPCYYITNSTTLFGKVEVSEGWQGSDRWQAVNTACYTLMKASRNATTGLVPDWCQTPSGALINGIINDKFESYFLYDAIRIPWRMAHAYAWYGHADAKDIASKITTWAQTNYNDPATIWDGYLLNGNVFNNPTGNPNFANLGKNHNPCFSGGLSVGATVDASFSSYMAKCWNVGSATDNYGAYYTHTTQLLYMMFLTGNMPNFWDMKPVPVAAETNANGNAIYVDFSKSLSTTTSTTGWTVQTFADEADVTPTAVTVSSLSVLDKRVTLNLSADIAEPFIKISYNGTTIKSSADNLTADAFSNMLVTNKITNMEPYPVLRMTDIVGTMVKIQWSKEINPSSINGGFSVKINGTAVTVGTPTLDSEDPTIVNIPLTGTLITSAADVVTVSFTGGSITGLTSTKTAKAFTDAPVQNFYLNVTCYTITDFDANLNVTFASWVTGVWNSAATDPAGGTNKVGFFNGDNTTAYISTKATVSAANKAAFGAALYTPGSRFKAKLYAKSGTFATGEQIKIVFAHAALADAGSYYDPNQVQFLITPPSYNAWFEVDLPINGVVDNAYDFIQMTGSNVDKTGNKTNADFYIDNMQICPAPPTVSYVTGRTSYDGGTIEVRFSTAMKVPTSASEISVTVDGISQTVTSIAAKQGDATVLVLTLATPINDPEAVITVSGGSSAGLKAVDGRMADYFYMAPVVNLVGISVTTGWRDNFNSTTDYITANIGVGTAWATPAPQEIATGDGYYKIVGNGSAAWSSVDITTWVNQANANKEVMDLSGREKVEIRYRIPTGNTSTTLYMRVDMKDKANGTASDAMAFIPLTISTTWQTKTIDMSAYFVKKYGVSEPIVVDRSNIYQVMFYFIEKEGTAANNYVPTNFKGTIEFDYISIGSALILTVPTTTINEGQTLSATSSATGKIYIVPNNTPPVLTALQDSVFASRGKVVDVTANVAASIATTGLKPGYYFVYAYDPTAGAISAKVGVQINDITAPIISPFSSGNISATGTISATVNEDAMLYLIPSSETNYTIANIIDKAVYQLAVAKDVAASILLSDINPPLTVGSSYKFIAADYAITPNISTPTTPNITIVNAPLTMTVNPTGSVEQGSPITVGVSRAATAYLIPNSVLISAVADLDANDVSKVTISSASGTLSTVGVPVGEYYVYVSDGTAIVGPSAKITVEVSTVVVTNIELLSTALSLKVGETKTTEVVFTPTNATNKGLTITADPTYVTVTYNETTRIVSVTGVKGAAAPIQVILTSPDGPSTTLSVTVTQFPTSITVSPATTTNLKVGGTVQLTETVLPADAQNKAVTWTSSNPTVASVNSTGLVTGVAIGGPVTITATSTADGTIKGTATVTVVKTDVSSISVDPTTVTLTLGQSATVTATVLPADATNKNVTWTSSAPGVATVTNGVINSVSVGTATITVTSVDNPSVSATIAVTVNNVAVSSVTVAPTTTSIVVGATESLTATVLPANAPQTVTWASSNPAIATVSAAGVVTGVAVGTATITATSTADGTKTATCAVTVTPKLVSSITIVPATVSINIGATQSLTATVLPNDATNKDVTWSSSNPAVATVSATGVVTGVSAGTATITATAADGSGKTGTCAVTVTTIPVSSISILPATASINIGETQALTESVLPANATVKTVTWSSSNSAVATVSATGVVTGVSAGTATITATATDGSGITGTCAVTVNAILPTSVSTSAAIGFVTTDPSQTLVATVLPANATDKSVTWISSNPAVATVNPTTGEVTPVGVGTAIITVTCVAAPSVKATCTVTVDASVTPVTGVTVDQPTLNISIGSTGTITATVNPAGATNKSVTWSSSNPAVATVSNGIVTAVSVGSATITVTTVDGSFTATTAVTVSAISVTGVTLDQTTLSLAATSAPVQLVATVNPANATNKNVTWSSSNTSVATVSATGIVTVQGIGTTTITVTTVDGNHTAICAVTVSAISATSINLDQSTLTLTPVSAPVQLQATVLPADASDKSVTWTSSNPSVVTVSTTGVVTVVGVGSATITAKANGGVSVETTCAVTVNAIPVTSVTLDQSSLTLSQTSTPVTLIATINPANATNKSVTWTSSNPAAVTVSATGVVSPVGLGTSTITVTTVDGAKTAICIVTVSATPVTSITLDQPTLTMTVASTPVQLVATVLPNEASDKSVTWTTSASSVATVNTSGVVTAVGVGTATITATANDGSGKTATCTVTVNAIPVTGVTLDKTTMSLVVGGSNGSLIATVAPANATNKNITWSSSNPAVATVNDGVVTPVSAGTATITVTTVDGAKTATCEVTVGTNTIAVTGVSITVTSATIALNETVQLWAVVQPTNATNTNITWSSSDPTVATVDATGKVTPVSAGSAVITVTTVDGSKTATANITVTNIMTSSITLPNSIAVNVGATEQLIATVLPTGASTSVTWSSSAPAIATVSATGVVTGVAAGTATITATATDGTAKVSNGCIVTVSNVVIPVQSINFTQSTGLTVESGKTLDLGALLEINPTNASVQSITWSSNLPSAATISSTGVVTGQTVALATDVTITVRVTATNGVETSKTVNVTVTKPKILVTGITIPSTLSIQEGSTATVSATTIIPANADDKTVTWAIISGTGGTINASTGQINVTGAVGSTFTVQATANDAGAVKSNQCVVTIVQQVVPVVSIQASTQTVTIAKNGTATVTLTFNPTNTTQMAVTPEVGSTGVVSVSKISDTQYQITGLKGGTQQVIFRSTETPTVLASVNVTVTEQVEYINVTAAGSATSVNVGQTLQLTAVVSQPSATNKSVVWSSKDESKATVSATGLVTGVAEGYVTIVATAIDGSNVEGEFLLNVTKIPVTSISVNPITELEITKDVQIVYTIYPANATNKGLIFTSSNEAVATVSPTGVITGVSVGSVTITVASADDLSIVQEIQMVVTPIKANKDLLYTLIENEVFGAYSVYNKVQSGEIEIGFAAGQVSPLTYNKFLTAWSNAQDVYWDNDATQEEVDDAVMTLYKAIQAMGVVIPEDEVPISIDDVVIVEAKVYPTKVSTYVTIEAADIISVSIVGTDGKVITTVKVQGNNSVVVPTIGLVQGNYFVQVVTSHGIIVKQIVK